jgi:hypothetical protein
MTKRAWVPLCLSLLFLFVQAGGVRQATAAQQQKPTGDGELRAPATAEPPGPVGVTATESMSFQLLGAKGRVLGQTHDLLLNMEEADAAYIVIAVGGFLDIGEKLFPIPVQAVSIMTGKDVVLNINRKMLDQAPGFSSNQWQIMERPAQREKVSDYWKNILR